ncbi:hypothetical protein HOU00_gp405 [Caulobacter phage CcrPW]|uniref:Uncharacterized protein n=1 Tax=Caulobacter phage CcrPW TaxID=2283271 RepID=A0A385EAL3_9CAUD|nr:hypothetical protein HOU00_gp405 [Caulobacter phage CcrPW]AXQ68720.1 hypothetical protein CcrPW_gp181c [Caulobacter phage CcrPW]
MNEDLKMKVARAVLGPYLPLPPGTNWTLDELRQKRWERASADDKSLALQAAGAILREYDLTPVAVPAVWPEGRNFPADAAP